MTWGWLRWRQKDTLASFDFLCNLLSAVQPTLQEIFSLISKRFKAQTFQNLRKARVTLNAQYLFYKYITVHKASAIRHNFHFPLKIYEFLIIKAVTVQTHTGVVNSHIHLHSRRTQIKSQLCTRLRSYSTIRPTKYPIRINRLLATPNID